MFLPSKAALAVLFAIMLAACAQPFAAPNTTSRALDVLPAGAQTPLLEWHGSTTGEVNATACQSLRATSATQIELGACDQSATTAALGDTTLADMLDRIAPFQYAAGNETLAFNGHGALSGPAWQRAVLAWTRGSYTANTARPCASCQTAMSWFVGTVPDQPDQCLHLSVLRYGYAYAETTPCAGGQATSTKRGWLSTDEWTQIDQLLATRAPAYQNNNYLDGSGTQPASNADLAQLDTLAHTIYNRLKD